MLMLTKLQSCFKNGIIWTFGGLVPCSRVPQQCPGGIQALLLLLAHISTWGLQTIDSAFSKIRLHYNVGDILCTPLLEDFLSSDHSKFSCATHLLPAGWSQIRHVWTCCRGVSELLCTPSMAPFCALITTLMSFNLFKYQLIRDPCFLLEHTTTGTFLDRSRS